MVEEPGFAVRGSAFNGRFDVRSVIRGHVPEPPFDKSPFEMSAFGK